ncbi:5-formyltetrahydrofolate cyclo-ligase [Nanoarchaeota archaeon]
MESKQQIRSEVLEKRKFLPKLEVEEKSVSIINNFLNSDFYKNNNNIMVYCSLDKNNEVNTLNLIDKMLKDKKNIIAPYVKNNKIAISQIFHKKDLNCGTFGILEPKDTQTHFFDEDNLDVVIVPGIAFDERKNRIGYGKGFYDEFLKKTKAAKIAFALELQVLDKIPQDPHDEKVDIIITEERVIK